MMIRRYIKFYYKIIKFSTSLKMVYKFNFWANLITDLNYYVIHILVFLTLYRTVDSIGKWDSYEMMFFMGTFITVGSLANVIYFSGLLCIPEYIRTGKLDLFITKPINTLFYVSVHKFDFSALFNCVFGGVVLVYSGVHIKGHLNFMIYIFMMAVSLGLFYVLLGTACTMSFWFVKTNNFLSLSDELFSFSYRVPGILYKGITKVVFYIILPYGLLFTMPTKAFLGELNITDIIYVIGANLLQWIGFIIIWKKGMKRYNSASN